jgi:DNA polymerase I-like protein with 3'-5' exonuclease and polymerase domains
VQLGARLPTTKTGRVSVAAGVLEPYKGTAGPLGDFVRARLDYQKSETALGLILEPYRQLVDRGDGRARPTVYTLGADTGRMSCVRPNLQQVPREGGYRACITADPGQLLISADFAGVELRVAAALSGDSNLRRLIAEEDAGQGDGVHWAIARLAFGPGATKADRYAVKRGVFGRIYGGGIPAIARGVGVSETVAAAIIDALDAMLPELSAWSQRVRESVKAGQTQFPTYSGRIVHLPAAFPHKAPNYCIQGTARELLIDTLIRLRETRWGDATLLPVHDELVLAVPEDEAADATAGLVAAMQTELYGVAIKAEASEPGFSWRDAS